MKALKTVAVALGITLAALIVIPLIVLAGLFVWLKVTEEQTKRSSRARSRRRLIDATPKPSRRPARRRSRLARPPVLRRAFRCPRRTWLPANDGSPRSPSSGSWSCGPPTSSS